MSSSSSYKKNHKDQYQHEQQQDINDIPEADTQLFNTNVRQNLGQSQNVMYSGLKNSGKQKYQFFNHNQNNPNIPNSNNQNNSNVNINLGSYANPSLNSNILEKQHPYHFNQNSSGFASHHNSYQSQQNNNNSNSKQKSEKNHNQILTKGKNMNNLLIQSQQQQYGNNGQQLESHNPIQKQEQLKQIILDFQNQSEKGYYTYQEWKKLHQELFNIQKRDNSADGNGMNKKTSSKNPMMTLLDQTVINMWRILKLINFGDDYVPTGLIYDTLLSVTKVDGSSQQVQAILKSIFFKFIQFNGKYLSDKQRQQLAFFKVIRPVVQGYRKVIARKLKFENDLLQEGQQQGITGSKKNLKKSYENFQNYNRPNTKHQQLYRLHTVFTYKKNLQKLKKIQEQFKQCSFQPQINRFQDYKVQSRYMNSKTIPYKKLHNIPQSQNSIYTQNSQLQNNQQFAFGNQPIEEQQGQQYQLNKNRQYQYFTAKPVPQYPQVVPNGLQEHLQRMQKSREIQRINSIKTWKAPASLLSSHDGNPFQQFDIQKRNQIRKQNSISQFKILFMIKVEVNKKIYRIKVRQNMNLKQTTKAIEKMVGFSHPDIQTIVKSYFMNWQKRCERVEQSMRKKYGSRLSSSSKQKQKVWGY